MTIPSDADILIVQNHIPFGSLRIAVEEVLYEMQPEATAGANDFASVIEPILEAAHSFSGINFAARIFGGGRFNATQSMVEFDSVTLRTEGVIASELDGMEACAVLLATAGPKFDALAKEYAGNDDLFSSYVVETIGGLVAERVADSIEIRLRDAEGFDEIHSSDRYSPGYCDWVLTDQRGLFSLFPPRCCGIELTNGLMMRPTKSVSGVVGLRKTPYRRGYTCYICDSEDCVKSRRRAGTEQNGLSQ